MQQFLVKSCLVSTLVGLTGCAGPGQMFEPRMYDIRQSVWVTMSEDQKQHAIVEYQKEQERLAHIRKIKNIAELNFSRYENNPRNHYHNSEYYDLSGSDRDIYDKKIRELKDEKREREERREKEQRDREQLERRQREIDANNRRLDAYRQAQAANTRLQTSQSHEQLDLDEARHRSLATYHQEQSDRQIRQQREQQELDEAKRRSLETYRQEEAARSGSAPVAPTAPASNAWQPNEGQLVKGGQLVMQLQRDLGQRPSATQMNSHLQTNMGLSSSQAQTIIDELGLY